MKTQSQIALLLTLVFLVKFIAVDSNGLNVLFGGDNITFVKLDCKKKNSPKQTKKRASFSQVDLYAAQVIAINGFCNSQCQINLIAWETERIDPSAVFCEHFPSNLSYRYLDNDSPPPRLA
ncbi:MAG: hypothetical protein WA951_06450 [Leeuwenhoekiella sp.]